MLKLSISVIANNLTDIEIVNDNEIVITAFNISPEGQESKATETVYNKIPNS